MVLLLRGVARVRKIHVAAGGHYVLYSRVPLVAGPLINVLASGVPRVYGVPRRNIVVITC